METVPNGLRRIDLLRLLVPAGIFLLALTARILPGPRTIDDSFITYRYARNLLAGEGFVYNPGERVMGTTTPLYTLLLTSTGLVSGGEQAPFPQIAMMINALADGAVCLLLILLGRRSGFRFAGVGAALTWAVAPFSVTFAIGGLETSLYVFLLIGAVAAHVDNRPILAALLSALAFLTRPDALILIAPLAFDRILMWWRGFRLGELNTRKMFSELLAFGVPVTAWIIFAALYFGSPVPHSIEAKTLAYQLAPDAGFVRLLQHYATPFLEHHTFGIPWIGLGLVLHPFLYIVGAYTAIRNKPRLWPLVIYPWLYFAVFSLANPLIFRWYLTPPLPGYFLFILGGVELLVFSIAAATRKRFMTGSDNQTEGKLTIGIAASLVIIAPFVLSLRDWQLQPDHGIQRPAPEMAWYKLELLYRQAAENLLAENQKPDDHQAILAAGDVGVLGFVTGLHILDTVGLNSPQTTNYYPIDPAYYTINYAVPPQLILDVLPDYLVVLEVYGRAGLFKDPLFWKQYELRQKIQTDIYGSDGMLIFERIIH